jgi:hypothetical protein
MFGIPCYEINEWLSMDSSNVMLEELKLVHSLSNINFPQCQSGIPCFEIPSRSYIWYLHATSGHNKGISVKKLKIYCGDFFPCKKLLCFNDGLTWSTSPSFNFLIVSSYWKVKGIWNFKSWTNVTNICHARYQFSLHDCACWSLRKRRFIVFQIKLYYMTRMLLKRFKRSL